ncbi:MAG: DUF4292 domain-containing protein [Tannerella sp.]|jgi:hypothetical protein|nr:DUF4292 domain-containing protein [Tannerella sp.]
MMKNKSFILVAGICLLGFSLLTGCRSPKEAATGSVKSLKTEEAFFLAVQEQSIQYRTLSARLQFNVVMPSGKELSSRAQLKIQKNDRLQLSVQFLGFEVFRAELTPDSIKMIDRMNKRYLLDEYSQIKEEALIDFNFYNLQALFTNQLFLPGENQLPNQAFNRFQWKRTDDGYILQTTGQAGMRYLFTADREERLCTTEIRSSAHHTVQWNYADFRPVDNRLFPMKANALLDEGSRSQSALALTYSQVEVNVPVEISFKVPSGYEKVSLSQILQTLEKL